jgi:hypothetical protein
MPPEQRQRALKAGLKRERPGMIFSNKKISEAKRVEGPQAKPLD